MLVKLRIIFTILAAICAAAVIPVGTFLDWLGALGCGIGALLFFGAMLLCKNQQEKRERPETSNYDFLNPAPTAEEKPDNKQD